MTTSEKQLISVLFLAAALAALNFSDLAKKNKIVLAEERTEEIKREIYEKHFGRLDLLAESALVYDVSNRKDIFGLKQNKPLPLASLTKIMTAVAALENMPRDSVVEISGTALGEEGDNGLYLAEKWNLEDLVKFMLLASSNDAAEAIAEQYERTNSGRNFIDLMNKNVLKLGLEHTNFLTPGGLDLGGQVGSLGNAKDVARLFAYALEQYSDIFGATAYAEQNFQSLSGIKHIVQNTNELASYFPEIIASKTGLTALAGGNLAISFDFGIQNPIIVVVLGSTEHGRFKDALALSLATVNYLSDLAKIE